MQPFVESSNYVNDLVEMGEQRVQEAYGPNYARLVALKDKYDPTNFFRLNAKIKPTVCPGFAPCGVSSAEARSLCRLWAVVGDASSRSS